MTRQICACSIAAVIGAFTPSIVHAQAASAMLSGTVLDGRSAVVPDAKISIVNVETALRREMAADAQGSFVFPLRSPGR